MNESESCADFDNLSVEESEVWNSRSSSHRSQGTRNVATFFVGTRLLSVFVFLCVVCFSVCLFRFRAWQLALATRGLSFADQSWNLYIQMSHLSRIMYNKAAAEKRRPKTKNKANFCILRHWLWSGYVSYPHRQHPHPQKQIVKKIMSCRRKNKGRKREENLVFFLRSLPSFHCCRLFLVGGDPLFCLATAFNAMFLGMFWLWLVASCLWWILRHVTFYVLHPHAPAWSSHLKKVGSTANFMPGKKCDNHTRGAIHNN